MKPKQILKALLKQDRVKLTEEYFNKIEYTRKNSFIIYQIEANFINLYSQDLDIVVYEVPFDEILKIER